MDRMRIAVVAAVGLLALGALGGGQGLAAAAGAPTVHQWMTASVGPRGSELSDVVIKAMDDNGKPSTAGMKPADWAAIIKAAQALKAGAEQVASTPALRVVADGAKIQDEGKEGFSTAAQVQGFIDKDRDGFNAMARGLATTADTFIAAANAKDPAKLLDASTALDAACGACHTKFWYPQQAQ